MKFIVNEETTGTGGLTIKVVSDEVANERLRRGVCPDCGGPMRKYYLPNGWDPGDVEPKADCLNPACGWGY